MQILSLILALIMMSSPISIDWQRDRLVAWNVGQGQWVTWIDQENCLHFDMGGEFNVSSQVLRLCNNKMNQIVLSHWDSDHINFVKKFAYRANKVCLYKLPRGKSSPQKLKSLLGLLVCTKFQDFVELEFAQSKQNPKYPNFNKLSRVIIMNKSILFPGDSPISEEKKWIKSSSFQRGRINITGLILGHHGSRTSTSSDLLSELPNLKWAVASSRKSRYGHPHSETLERLHKRQIPVLITEDWGNIHFLLQ